MEDRMAPEKCRFLSPKRLAKGPGWLRWQKEDHQKPLQVATNPGNIPSKEAGTCGKLEGGGEIFARLMHPGSMCQTATCSRWKQRTPQVPALPWVGGGVMWKTDIPRGQIAAVLVPLSVSIGVSAGEEKDGRAKALQMVC